MTRKQKIFINTASNIGLQFINMAIRFILMPLVLAYFGKEVFGINAYIGSIVLIFNFFGFAISMSLMKYIPEMIGKNEYKQINKLIFSVLPISVFLYFILGLLIFTFPLYGLNWFNVPENLQTLTKSVMQLIGIFTCLQFLQPIAGGILSGFQHFHLHNKIMIISVISSILAYIIVKKTNTDLFYYVLISQIGMFIVLIIKVYYCIKVIPFKIKFVKPDFKTLKRVFGFNLYLISNQVADHFMYTTDRLILQKVLGPVSVTYYHVGRRISDLVRQFTTLPTSALIPECSKAFATNDDNFLTKLNITGQLLYNFLIIPASIVFILLLDKFIVLWVGPDFKTSILIGRLFLLNILISTVYRFFIVNLISNNKVKEIGISKFVYCIINMIVSYILAKKIGILGVIIPTVFYFYVIYPSILFYLLKKLKYYTIKEFLSVTLPSILTITITIILFYFGSNYLKVDSWISFIRKFTVFYLISSVIYLLFTKDSERKNIFHLIRSIKIFRI